MRVLAVDWGERRIGLAVSDPQEIIASGLPTLVVNGLEQAATGVARVAGEVEAERVVVGLPLRMDGGRGEAAEAAQRFADRLRERARRAGRDLRRALHLGAQRAAAARDRPCARGGAERGQVDQGAAVALLESYLVRMSARRARGEEP